MHDPEEPGEEAPGDARRDRGEEGQLQEVLRAVAQVPEAELPQRPHELHQDSSAPALARLE
eukprot:7617378-Heterocapsa_arctica.AAC.1